MADDQLGAWELIDEAEGRDIGAIVLAAVGSFIYAISQGINASINAAFSLFVDPVDALIDGSVDIVNALWGGWVDILEEGAKTTVESLAPGSAWAIGPFTQALSILTVAIGLYLIAWVVGQEYTSNLVPGLLVDNRLVAFLTTTPEEEEEGTE